MSRCICWQLRLPEGSSAAADARGKGVGAELIKQVEKIARAAGASRIYWLTKEDNVSARALYDKLADRSGFIQYYKLF
jgi:GNAT superfamily N-acetyltransferase